MAKTIILTPEQKKEIASFLQSLVISEEQNHTDLQQRIDEYWMRHFGMYSAKKDKNFPWAGSADIQSGLIMYSDSGIEARFVSALNTVEFVNISSGQSKESNAAAKNVMAFFNNYWQHKTNIREILATGFNYCVVEGTMFIKIIPQKGKKKIKRYKFMEFIANAVDTVKQLLPDKEGKPVVEEKERDEFLGATWEAVPRLKVNFDSSAMYLNKDHCFWCQTEIEKTPSGIYEKVKEGKWYNLEKVIQGMPKNEVPQTVDQSKTMNEQTKNEYTGYTHTLTSKKIFKEFFINGYNVGTKEKPDYRKMMFVTSKDTGELVYHEENTFLDGRYPLESAPFYRIAGRIDGQGQPQRLSKDNDTIDLLLDQAMDNNTLCNTLTGTIIPQPGMDLDKVQMQPGKFIPVKAHDNVKQWIFSNRLPDILNILNFEMGLAERKSLVSDYTLGRESSINKKPTVRGTAMLLQEYGLNLDPLMQNVQGCLKRCVYQTIQDIYEFMPGDSIEYSYFDPAKQDYVKGKLTRSDLEYMDDFDIGVLQGAVDVMLQTEKQTASLLMQEFGQDQTGEINTYELKKNFVESVAPRDVNRFVKTPQDIEKLKQATQMLQQKAAELDQQQQTIMQQQQTLHGQVHAYIGAKAKLEESKFVHELQKQGATPEQIQQAVIEFRKQYMAREMGQGNPVVEPQQPPSAVPPEGQSAPLPQNQ